MVNKNSLSSAFLTAILVGGLLLASAVRFGAAQADSGTPEPSVPEFTLEYVDNSYDVPPTYEINPYTEKNVMTRDGCHVQNFVIDISVKNQNFSSVINGRAAKLYYKVRTKGRFEENWAEYYHDVADDARPFPVASSSEYTVFSIPSYYPPGGQVDFQVQAIIGYHTEVFQLIHPEAIVGVYVPVFESEKSSWSDTQTVTIPPYIPPLSISPQTIQLGVSIGMAVIVVVVLLVHFKKRNRQEGKHE